jgi:N-acyl-D-aspartate/D-glutamate deacylase
MTTAANFSRLVALKTFMNIAQGWQRKPRPAELDLLAERAKAALADLQFYYENADRILAALGPDAVREGAK